MPASKWNIDNIYEEMAKYSSRSEFNKKSSGAYGWVTKYYKGSSEDILSFYEMKYTLWDETSVQEEADKYTCVTDFKEGCSGAYNWAKRQDNYDDIVKHFIDKRSSAYFNGTNGKSGIYVLYLDDEIVYIGKSEVGIGNRLTHHMKDKDKPFNSVKVYLISNLIDLRILELYLIGKYTPRYNRDALVEDKPSVCLDGYLKNCSEKILEFSSVDGAFERSTL